MLIIAGKATIMTLLTIIAVAMCVVVIGAATVSCTVARKSPVYETPVNNEKREKEDKQG